MGVSIANREFIGARSSRTASKQKKDTTSSDNMKGEQHFRQVGVVVSTLVVSRQQIYGNLAVTTDHRNSTATGITNEIQRCTTQNSKYLRLHNMWNFLPFHLMLRRISNCQNQGKTNHTQIKAILRMSTDQRGRRFFNSIRRMCRKCCAIQPHINAAEELNR